MEFSNKKNESFFSRSRKLALPVGSEIGINGLYWRKLEDGTGVWRIDFSHDGVRYKETIGRDRDGITLTHAKQCLQKLRAEAITGQAQRSSQNSAAPMPFKRALELFLAWSEGEHRDARHNIWRANKYLLPTFDNQDLHGITAGQVESFKVSMLKQGLSASTVKKVLSLLSSIFRFAALSDETIENQVRKVKKPKPKSPEKSFSTFTEQEIASLLEAAGENSDHRVAVALAAYAGLRASEVLGLEWRYVKLEPQEEAELEVCQGRVCGHLGTTKSGRRRTVPIQGKLYSILLVHRNNSDGTGFVVKTESGDGYHKIQGFFRRLKVKAGISNGGFHALRHTFATKAIQKGIDLPTVKEWMGHSSIETTMLYVHYNKEHSKQAMRLLD